MKLKYDIFGQSGTPVIILHGLLGSAQNWRSVATRLSSTNVVVVPDLRNHGGSPHGQHTIELMCQDVLELRQSLRLVEPVLVGHSMGGLVAMSYAFEHPKELDKLCIVDMAPVSEMGRMNGIFEALRALPIMKLNGRPEAEKLLAESIDERSVRQFLLQNLKRDLQGDLEWRVNLPELHRFINDEQRFSFDESHSYDGPTLFIGGGRSEHNLESKSELVKRHFPVAHIEIIPEAGHWVHFDAPDAFLKRLLQFVNADQT